MSMIEQLENEKRCTGHCAAMLPLSYYYRQAASKDGHQSICKTCKRDAKRAGVSGLRKRNEWRPAEEMELLDHVARGLPLAMFAAKSGRTLSSVKNKANVLQRVPHIDADRIGRSPFQPSASAHIAWQQIDRKITVAQAANGPTYSLAWNQPQGNAA